MGELPSHVDSLDRQCLEGNEPDAQMGQKEGGECNHNTRLSHGSGNPGQSKPRRLFGVKAQSRTKAGSNSSQISIYDLGPIRL